ncbi:Lsr2 protein [Amycolatopsis sulphurea]|uniref:Lsr2 protein n=1 Tax=Amycolatopsis sulphurea TaxID=76022 RepID=A0A2A9FC11_9PSEU|nr:Lsr2 family protein [Amycolatopsis sulphurea]PFG48092.1 Lsr2 protein [Amycolatopsis sulphurea]
MAQRVAVEVLDDIDGTTGATSVHFGLDGAKYAIDLSEHNARALRDELARFVNAARRTGGRKNRGTGAPVPRRSGETSAARAWAIEQGIAVARIGRVSADLLEQYREAQRAPERPKPTRKRGPRKTAAAK